MRRAALDAIAFWDETRGRLAWFDENFRQSEDIECWTRLIATTPWTLGYVPMALTEYRVTSGGLSANTDAQLETWRRFRAKVASYAPALNAAHGDRAEAYQLRYLARRAIRSGDGKRALQLMADALGLSPAILRDEPARTVATLGAAVAVRALPKSLASQLLGTGMAMSGAITNLARPASNGPHAMPVVKTASAIEKVA
jgi:hypothetical protein